MKSLVANEQLSYLPESDRHGRYIFDGVREGLEPFKAHMIQIYMDYDIDFNRYWVVVDVKFKSGWRLRHKEPVDRDDLLSDPDLEIFKIANLMRDAFRNREDFYDLAPLISLGDN